MLIIGVIFFTLAVLFGSILFKAVIGNKRTPKSMVFLHGASAFFAILVLISYIAAGHTDKLLIIALILFLLAAGGGLTMFSFDVRKKPIPKVFAIVHPLVAISGLVVLIIYMVQQPVL